MLLNRTSTIPARTRAHTYTNMKSAQYIDTLSYVHARARAHTRTHTYTHTHAQIWANGSSYTFSVSYWLHRNFRHYCISKMWYCLIHISCKSKTLHTWNDYIKIHLCTIKILHLRFHVQMVSQRLLNDVFNTPHWNGLEALAEGSFTRMYAYLCM